MFRYLLLVLIAGLLYAQPNNTTRPDGTTKTTFPTDRNSRGVAVPYFWDSASNSYKPVGGNSIIFTRMDMQSAWSVATNATTTITLASGFKDGGVAVTNHGTATMMVWFDLGSSATGSAYDTSYIEAKASAFFPINADTLYIREATSSPEVEIQQGKVD